MIQHTSRYYGAHQIFINQPISEDDANSSQQRRCCSLRHGSVICADIWPLLKRYRLPNRNIYLLITMHLEPHLFHDFSLLYLAILFYYQWQIYDTLKAVSEDVNTSYTITTERKFRIFGSIVQWTLKNSFVANRIYLYIVSSI